MALKTIEDVTKLLESIDTMSVEDVITTVQAEAESFVALLSEAGTKPVMIDAMTKALDKITAEGAEADPDDAGGLIADMKDAVDAVFETDPTDENVKVLQTRLDEKLDEMMAA